MKLPFLILIFFLFGCTTGTKIYLAGKSQQVPNPPNMVEISDNFFADKTEITNSDYKEYLFDLNQLYGVNSAEYWAAHPDTTVRREIISYGEPYMENYFRHPSYNNYPVVGIDLAQAKNFSEWRTERVAEMFLIERGLIKIITNRKAAERFTIERYQEGGYHWIIRREAIAIPVFKIPTVEEWEKIAGINSSFEHGVDSLSRHNKKVRKKNKYLFCTNDNLFRSGDAPCPVRTFSENIFGLYHIIGNVSELVDQPNTVKGGYWDQGLGEISISKNQPFEKPNFWVGFRNVARFHLIGAESAD